MIEESSQLETLLNKLTERHDVTCLDSVQARYSREQKARLLDMIIGFEIEVSEVQGKFKLSQNRSQDDQQSVMQHLNDSASASDKATAALMLTI